MYKNILKDILLSVLLLGSIGLNLAQMRELNKLRDSSDSPGRLLVGSPAIRIAAHDLEGKPTAIPYSREVPTIIYVFSPRCGWCARNLANVAALSAQAGQRYQLVGLSVSAEGLPEYVREQGWTFPVYSKPSPEAIAYFRLQSTPQTIVISPEGRILESWTGAYANTTLSEVQRALKVQLPGLSD